MTRSVLHAKWKAAGRGNWEANNFPLGIIELQDNIAKGPSVAAPPARKFFTTHGVNRQSSGSTQKTTPFQERSAKSEALTGAEKTLRKVAYFGALLKFFLS